MAFGKMKPKTDLNILDADATEQGSVSKGAGPRHKSPSALISIAKWAGTFVFAVACLAAIVLIAMLLADRWVENSFFTAHILNFLLQNHLLHSLFVPAGILANLHITGFLGFVLVCIALAALRVLLAKALRKWQRHPRRAALVGALGLLANFVLLGLVVVLFLNMLMAGYVTRVFDDVEPIGANGTSYLDKVALVESHMQNSDAAVDLTLQKLMADVENGTVQLDTLSDEEYIDFAEVVCYLVDLKGGVDDKNLHYFRNYFGRAPATLDDMVDTILHKPDDLFHWKLLPPSSTFFHMAGQDGEYNLKFVSADGHFEAVYNKDGVLLLADNGPENMGTFNYADPVSNDKKHTVYDVEPYLAWGNVPGSPPIAKTLEADMKSKFEASADAKANYEKYKTLLYG